MPGTVCASAEIWDVAAVGNSLLTSLSLVSSSVFVMFMPAEGSNADCSGASFLNLSLSVHAMDAA